jgi:hypothetical protein
MTDLSPAAQAVLDAAYTLPLKNGQPSIAAAVRALADQVVPAEDVAHTIEDMIEQRIRDELRAIADELES